MRQRAMASSTPAARTGCQRSAAAAQPARAPRSCSGVLGTALVAAVIVLKPTVDDAIKEITLPLRHEDMIRQQARDKNLDPALVAAVIYRESKFRDQTSTAGAKGLMQILPETAQFIAQRSRRHGVRAARPRQPADQHLLRLLVPALPARPLRRQRGRGGRRLQRRPRARGRLGRQGPDARRHPLPRDRGLHPRRARQARRLREASTGPSSGSRAASSPFGPSTGRCDTLAVRCRPSSSTPPTRPSPTSRRRPPQLAEGIGAGDQLPDAAGRDRLGQDGHDGLRDRAGPEADARARPQQDARGPALQRVPRVLPRQRGRVLRLLLRLLPARGLRPAPGPLHREGLLDQRRDRPAAPRRHGRAVRARGRDHRRLGLGDLRHRLARALQGEDAAAEAGRVDRPRRDAAPARLDAVHRATTRTSRAAPSACAARCSRCIPPTPRAPTGSSCSATRSSGSSTSTRSPARSTTTSATSSVWPATHYVTADDIIERSLREIQHELEERVQVARGERQGAGGAPPAPAHRVRHGDAEGDGLLLGDRELLADPRRPPGRLAAAHADRLLPRRLRLLHRRVAPDRSADRRACTRATARASRRWSTTASGCRRRWTTGRCASTSSSQRVPQMVFVSATPGPFEREHSTQIVEQIVRPTGIVDPEVEVRETKHQIDDLMNEIRARAEVERARAGHDADEEDGRGPDRLPARVRVPRALPALGDRHDRAHPDHPRPAARRVRRAGRREPAARGARPAGGVAGRRSSTPTRRASCAARPA